MPRTIEVTYEDGVFRPTSSVPPDVREGERLWIIVPAGVSRASDEAEDEFEKELAAQGLLEQLPLPPQPAPPDWKPLQLDGEPLSETVLRLRGERG